METIKVNIFAILAFTIIFSFNVAFAGEWVRVIEMGESGLAVEFPMTPEEIVVEKAKRASRSAIRKAEPAVSSQKLKTIEMGESGYAVTFKMTAEEIAALNAENARLAAIRAVRTKTAPESVVVFELAESGHTIEFPAAIPEMDIGDLVIARDPSGNEAVRAQ